LPIEDIIASAASLRERLGGGYRPADSPANDALCAARWQQWASLLSKDDSELIHRRVALEGTDADHARSLLGDVRRADGIQAPAWGRVFRDAMAADGLDVTTDLPKEECLRWAAFYQPFLHTADALLETRADARLDILTPQARRDLRRILALRLEPVVRPALDLEYSIAQATASGGFPMWDDEDRVGFAREARGSFFHSYPAAARLLSLIVESWVEFVVEFLTRLENDISQVRAAFYKGSDPGRITSLSSPADPYRGGRSVLVAGFTTGRKLVYKPRSLGLEAGYFRLVDWIKTRAGETAPALHLKSLCVLDRPDYGWIEFVEHSECGTPGEVASYFERIGSLLALLYTLAGSDMHRSNFIAYGSQPVPVDLEVLLAPERDVRGFAPVGATPAPASAPASRDTVLAVGLLPRWRTIRPGHRVRRGALGIEESGNGAAAKTHLPRHEGVSISAHRHLEDIMRGFAEMYRFLETHRDALLSADGPFAAFRGLPVRLLNRSTALYLHALDRSTAAASLASGATRSFELDVLTKATLHAHPALSDAVHAITQCEIDSLEQGDIPFFQGRVDSIDLELPEIALTLPAFFSCSGFEVATRRLSNLSAADRAAQEKIIRESFSSEA